MGESHSAKRATFPPLAEPLPGVVYDNHSHLEMIEGRSVDEILAAAEQVGVAGVIQSSGDVEASTWAAHLAARDKRVLAAVAIHPNEAPLIAERGEGQLQEALDEIDALATHERVRAIGETGLDFFRTDAPGLAAQQFSFEAHIEMAKRHDLALQIHDRDAHRAVLDTLERVGAPERTVFHCFSGDDAMAKEATAKGYYLSFAGTVTFKNAPNLREALAVTPLDRILVETDAPFLTPAPFRGRMNAPDVIANTVRFMAAELELDLAELCAQIAANTIRVYGEF